MLLLLPLLMAAHSSLGSASNFSSIYHQSVDRTEMPKIIRYIMEKHYCTQVVLDDSWMASRFLELLHDSASISSILGSKDGSCDLRLYISLDIQHFLPLLTESPVLYSHFLVVLLNETIANMKRFREEEGASEKYFKDGRGVLVRLVDTEMVYRYSPILRNLNAISIAEFNKSKLVRSGLMYENFGGKKLRLGTFNCTINSRIGPLDKNGKPEWLEGVEMKFVDELSVKLNFSYEVLTPPEGEGIGTVAEDRKWHGGLMRMIGDKEVDLAFCGVWLSVFKRLSNLSLSAPINDLCLSYLVPRPLPLSQQGRGLFSSFDWLVWASFALQTLCVALLSQGLAWLADKYSLPHRDLAGFTKFEKSFLVLWATLFNNAPRSLAAQGPLRHVFSWWAIVSLVLNTCFSSSLISHLTKAAYAKPMETIKELVENDFFWCLKTFPTFGAVFDLDDKWEREWTKRYCVADPEEQCLYIENSPEKYAVFVVDYGEGIMTQRDLPCELKKFQTMNHCVNKYLSGLAFQTKSPYEPIFSDYIKRYMESGLFHKGYQDEFHRLALQHVYMTEVKVTMDKTDIKRIRLKVSNILATFYLLAFGIVLSVVVFISELIWYNKNAVFTFMCMNTNMQEF